MPEAWTASIWAAKAVMVEKVEGLHMHATWHLAGLHRNSPEICGDHRKLLLSRSLKNE